MSGTQRFAWTCADVRTGHSFPPVMQATTSIFVTLMLSLIATTWSPVSGRNTQFKYSTDSDGGPFLGGIKQPNLVDKTQFTLLRELLLNSSPEPRSSFAQRRTSREALDARKTDAKPSFEAKKLVHQLQDDIYRLENVVRRQLEQLRHEDVVTLAGMSTVKDKLDQLLSKVDLRKDYRRSEGRTRRDIQHDSTGFKKYSLIKKSTKYKKTSNGTTNARHTDLGDADVIERDVSLSTSVSDILQRINDLEYRRKPTLNDDRYLMMELEKLEAPRVARRISATEVEEQENAKSTIEKRKIQTSVAEVKSSEKTSTKSHKDDKNVSRIMSEQTGEISKSKPGERPRMKAKVKVDKNKHLKHQISRRRKLPGAHGKKSHPLLMKKTAKKQAGGKPSVKLKNFNKFRPSHGARKKNNKRRKGTGTKLHFKSLIKAPIKRKHRPASGKSKHRDYSKGRHTIAKVAGKKSGRNKATKKKTQNVSHNKLGPTAPLKSHHRKPRPYMVSTVSMRRGQSQRKDGKHLRPTGNEIVTLNDVIAKLDYIRQLCRRIPSHRSPTVVRSKVKRASKLLASSKRSIRKIFSAFRHSKQQPDNIRTRVTLMKLHLSGILKELRRGKPAIESATGLKQYRHLKRLVAEINNLVNGLSSEARKTKVRQTSGSLGTLFIVTEVNRVMMSMKVGPSSAGSSDEITGMNTSSRQLELERRSGGNEVVFDADALTKIQNTFGIGPQVAKQIGPIVDSLHHDKAETGARWTDWSSWSSFEACSSVPCHRPAAITRQRVCVSISRVTGCRPGPGQATKSCPLGSRPDCLKMAASYGVGETKIRGDTPTVGNKTAVRSFKMAKGSCLMGDEMTSQLRSPSYAGRCRNGGRCISVSFDHYDARHQCVCPYGFSGPLCEDNWLLIMKIVWSVLGGTFVGILVAVTICCIFRDRIDWPWSTDKTNDYSKSKTANSSNVLPFRTNDNTTRRTATSGRSSNYNSNINQYEAPANQSWNSVNHVDEDGGVYSDDDYDNDDDDHDFRPQRLSTYAPRPHLHNRLLQHDASAASVSDSGEDDTESDELDSDWLADENQFFDVEPPTVSIFFRKRSSSSDRKSSEDGVWNRGGYVEEADVVVDPTTSDELARRISTVSTRRGTVPPVDLNHELSDDVTRDIESRTSEYRGSSLRQSEPEKDQFVYVEVPLELDVDQALRYVKERWLANNDQALQYGSPLRHSLPSATTETTSRELSKNMTSPAKPRQQLPSGNTERDHRSTTADTATPGRSSADGTLIGQLVQLHEQVIRSIDGTIVDVVGRGPVAGNNLAAAGVITTGRLSAPRANSLSTIERRMYNAMQSASTKRSQTFDDATTQTSQVLTPLRPQGHARANDDVITDGNVGDVIMRDRSLYRNDSVGECQTTHNAVRHKNFGVMGKEGAANNPGQTSMNTSWNSVNQVVRLSAPQTRSPLIRSSVDVSAVQPEVTRPGTSSVAYRGADNEENSSSNGAWIQRVIRSAAAAAIGATKRRADVVDDKGAEVKSTDEDDSAGTTWLTARRAQPSLAVNDDRIRAIFTAQRQNSERPLNDENESQIRSIGNDLEKAETCYGDDDVDTANIHGQQRVFDRCAPDDVVHASHQRQQTVNRTDSRIDELSDSLSEDESRRQSVPDVQLVTFSTQQDAPLKQLEMQSKASAYENVDEEVNRDDGITVGGQVDQKHRRRKHVTTSHSNSTSTDGASSVQPSGIRSQKKKHERNRNVRRKSTDGGVTKRTSGSEQSENIDDEDDERYNDNDNQGHRSQHQNKKDTSRHRHGNNGKRENRISVHNTHGRKKAGSDRSRDSGTLNSDSADENLLEVGNKFSSGRRRSSGRNNQIKVEGCDGWRTNIIGLSGKIPVKRASNQRAQTGNQFGRRNSPDSAAAIAMIQQMPPPEEHFAERKQQRPTGSRFNVAARKAGVYKPKMQHPVAILPGSRDSRASVVTLRQPAGLITPEATNQISGTIIDKRERFASGVKVSTGATMFNIPGATKRSALDEWNFRKLPANTKDKITTSTTGLTINRSKILTDALQLIGGANASTYNASNLLPTSTVSSNSLFKLSNVTTDKVALEFASSYSFRLSDSDD